MLHTSKFDPKTVVFSSLIFIFSKLNNEIEHKRYGIVSLQSVQQSRLLRNHDNSTTDGYWKEY